MKVINTILLLLVLWASTPVLAQTDRQLIRSGNRFFYQQDYAKAEVEYRKAISLNGNNAHAIYNLGCALQAQQKDSAAIVQFENAGKIETNKIRKSKSFHNIGVICQSRQMYGEAAEAYKQSLRNNPNDNETRYNYVLCKRLMKNQKKQDSQSSKDKDKNGQNKQQEKGKDKEDKREQQQNKEQMSRENAEQLLNAAIQEEKATQERMKKAMQQPSRRSLQKNW